MNTIKTSTKETKEKYAECIHHLLSTKLVYTQQISLMSTDIIGFCLEQIVTLYPNTNLAVDSPFSRLLALLLETPPRDVVQRVFTHLLKNKHKGLQFLEYELVLPFMKIGDSKKDEQQLIPMLLFSSRFLESDVLNPVLEETLLNNCLYVLREGLTTTMIPLNQLIDAFAENQSQKISKDQKASLLSDKFKPSLRKSTNVCSQCKFHS